MVPPCPSPERSAIGSSSSWGSRPASGLPTTRSPPNWAATTKSQTPLPRSRKATTKKSSIPCRWRICSMWGLPPPKNCGPSGSAPSAGWPNVRRMCCSAALARWVWYSARSQEVWTYPRSNERIISLISSRWATPQPHPEIWKMRKMSNSCCSCWPKASAPGCGNWHLGALWWKSISVIQNSTLFAGSENSRFPPAPVKN